MAELNDGRRIASRFPNHPDFDIDDEIEPSSDPGEWTTPEEVDRAREWFRDVYEAAGQSFDEFVAGRRAFWEAQYAARARREGRARP